MREGRSSGGKVGTEFPATPPSRSDTWLSSSHLSALGFRVLPHRPPMDSHPTLSGPILGTGSLGPKTRFPQWPTGLGSPGWLQSWP